MDKIKIGQNGKLKKIKIWQNRKVEQKWKMGKIENRTNIKKLDKIENRTKLRNYEQKNEQN